MNILPCSIEGYTIKDLAEYYIEGDEVSESRCKAKLLKDKKVIAHVSAYGVGQLDSKIALETESIRNDFTKMFKSCGGNEDSVLYKRGFNTNACAAGMVEVIIDFDYFINSCDLPMSKFKDNGFFAVLTGTGWFTDSDVFEENLFASQRFPDEVKGFNTGQMCKWVADTIKNEIQCKSVDLAIFVPPGGQVNKHITIDDYAEMVKLGRKITQYLRGYEL